MWGTWTEVSGCSHSCGGGTRYRLWMCNNPSPSFGGNWCSGNATEIQQYKTQACPGKFKSNSIINPRCVFQKPPRLRSLIVLLYKKYIIIWLAHLNMWYAIKLKLGLSSNCNYLWLNDTSEFSKGNKSEWDKNNLSLVFSGNRKIPTRGYTVSVGNEGCRVSHWNDGHECWDFPVDTEHQ